MSSGFICSSEHSASSNKNSIEPYYLGGNFLFVVFLCAMTMEESHPVGSETLLVTPLWPMLPGSAFIQLVIQSLKNNFIVSLLLILWLKLCLYGYIVLEVVQFPKFPSSLDLAGMWMTLFPFGICLLALWLVAIFVIHAGQNRKKVRKLQTLLT